MLPVFDYSPAIRGSESPAQGSLIPGNERRPAMRALLLMAAISLGWLWASEARAQEGWPPRPPVVSQYGYTFGSTPYNGFQYHVPHLERHYYTPPRFAPNNPP